MLFVERLLHWQARINLIGPSTVRQVWRRHIADSLQVLPLLPKPCRAILDLGSGAGLPGLVLAIAGNLEAHLVESSGKRAAFLRDAARHTGARVMVHDCRIEMLNRATIRARINAVTARALAPLPQLLGLAEPWLAEGVPAFFHKGQHVDDELTEASKSWKFMAMKHPSITEAGSVILEMREVLRA